MHLIKYIYAWSFSCCIWYLVNDDILAFEWNSNETHGVRTDSWGPCDMHVKSDSDDDFFYDLLR